MATRGVYGTLLFIQFSSYWWVLAVKGCWKVGIYRQDKTYGRWGRALLWCGAPGSTIIRLSQVLWTVSSRYGILEKWLLWATKNMREKYGHWKLLNRKGKLGFILEQLIQSTMYGMTILMTYALKLCTRMNYNSSKELNMINLFQKKTIRKQRM